ncbi:MAG TPA: hypothetical protein VEK38_03200 [Candidatus Bathyarchaeia archaeon]|nr:hypothetical protein [Candidatus Bathyarchaeia archaeon]
MIKNFYYALKSYNIVCWYAIGFCVAACSATSLLPAAKGAGKKTKTISPLHGQAQQLFTDIVGYSEEKLRSTFSWNEGTMGTFDFKKKDEWVQGNKKRAAIFYKEPQFCTIRDLDTILKRLKDVDYNRSSRSCFKILIYDPANEYAYDVRRWQASKENKGAFVQIASTPWAALEGGMYNHEAKLYDMYKTPVQGELAVLGALGGAIYRKYFLPTKNCTDFNRITTNAKNQKSKKNIAAALKQRCPFWEKGYWYDDAFRYVRAEFTLHFDPTKDKQPHITIKKREYDKKDIQKIQFCTHPVKIVSTCDNKGNVKEVSEDQFVTQLFVSAYDTLQARKIAEKHNRTLDQSVINLCKIMLNASYEFVIKSAAVSCLQDDKNQPRILLTMLGGGAFRNEAEWITFAIERAVNETKDLRDRLGMELIYVYRPDKKREYPLRGMYDDTKHLEAIARLADKVNGTKYAESSKVSNAIKNYVICAYGSEKYPKEISEAAKILQELLEGKQSPEESQPVILPKQPTHVPQIQPTQPAVQKAPHGIWQRWWFTIKSYTTRFWQWIFGKK